jgi:hypothetical protein
MAFDPDAQEMAGAASQAAKAAVRMDTASQGLTDVQKLNGRTNLDTRSTSEISFPTVAAAAAATILPAVNVVQTRAYGSTGVRRGGARYVRTAASFLTATSIACSPVAGNTYVTSTSALAITATPGGPITGTGILPGTTVTTVVVVPGVLGAVINLSQPVAASGGTAVSVPQHGAYFLSADTSCWVLNEDEPNLWMFGALGDFSDDTLPIQKALNWLASGAGTTLIIPVTQSAFRFLSDVRLWGGGGYVIRGAGGKSKLDCRNGSRFIVGHAVVTSYDSLGRGNKGGVKVVNTLFEKLAFTSAGGNGEMVLLDYADTTTFRDITGGNNIQTGGGNVTHMFKCNWTQWVTFDSCSGSANGALIWIEQPATTLENEDHYSIINCNLYCSKTRDPSFAPCTLLLNRSLGAAMANVVSMTFGSTSITFPSGPKNYSGGTLGNGNYAIDGPGIPNGAYVVVTGSTGVLMLNNSMLTADASASPAATATDPAAAVNLHIDRSAPIYHFRASMGHWGSFMSGANVSATTTAGSATVTVAAANGIAASMPIEGPGIPIGNYVSSVTGTTVVMANAFGKDPSATATGTAVPLVAGDDGGVSAGVRIAAQVPFRQMFFNAIIDGVQFEYIDYPMDFYRFATRDSSHVVMRGVTILQAHGTVLHGSVDNTAAMENAKVLQSNVLVDGPVVAFGGVNNCDSITTVTKQAYGRLHLANKGPGKTSLKGVTLRNNGTANVATGATSVTVAGITLSALPDIMQASPSWDHGGWWFATPTLSAVTASGGGTVSITINFKNVAPAGATCGWTLEVADA